MVRAFLDYVVSRYLGEDSQKGDLANDMKKFKDYLSKYARYNLNIFSDFEDALTECWNEFKNSEEFFSDNE